MSEFPCSFTPWDSDTWVNLDGMPDDCEESYSEEPSTIYNLPPSSVSESESDVPVATNEDHCVVTTDLKDLKAVVQTKTHYDGSVHISNWLTQYPGLIILPLTAISFVRKPTGHHVKNPQVLVYLHDGHNAQNYTDFAEAVDFLYSK